MKTAFLFPGQGAQVVGMGADVARCCLVASEMYANADEIVGFKLSKICFEGPQETLDTTTISQPAIFVTSAAILEVLLEETDGKFIPDVTAGLSLGEYTALYAAGVIGFEDALKLVRKRGEAMQAAADTSKGAMVSIIGLDEEKVSELCDKARQGGILEAVNFNCPGQIVLSGDTDACKRAEVLAVDFGAIKAVPLAVAGAFHTSMMSSAADELQKAIENTQISNPDKIKTIANINAEYYESADEIATGLVKQLTSPILWQKSMERLLADGAENFYEIGPGRVLTGLFKRINRKIKVTNLSGSDALKSVVGS
jgi:[acyl-carrier-protein] S-malonyltransferase